MTHDEKTRELKVKRFTCIKEPCIYLNQHRDGSVIPRAATFSCNVCNHQELWVCNQQSVWPAIPVLYRLHIYTVPGLLSKSCHMDQLSGNHLYIYEQGPPLLHIVLNRSSSRLIFWPSAFASASGVKELHQMIMQIGVGLLKWISGYSLRNLLYLLQWLTQEFLFLGLDGSLSLLSTLHY